MHVSITRALPARRLTHRRTFAANLCNTIDVRAGYANRSIVLEIVSQPEAVPQGQMVAATPADPVASMMVSSTAW